MIVPTKGETYFYYQRPVTVMAVDTKNKTALIRAENTSKRLDRWVEWSELK